MIVERRCPTRAQAAIWPALLVVALGCRPDTGPARYDLTGKATYGGAPIPLGTVQFTPDASKGNQGPGSIGDIEDGVYQTRPRKGVLGGAYIVTIDGHENDSTYSGLFEPFTLEVSLPEQGGTFDFDVPAAAHKPRKNFRSIASPGVE